MMSKGEGIFLIHFVRLGVLQKITEMASEVDHQNQEQLIDANVSKMVCVNTLSYLEYFMRTTYNQNNM